MKMFNALFYIAIITLAVYGLLTRDDSSWRAAVPYFALYIAAIARFKQEVLD